MFEKTKVKVSELPIGAILWDCKVGVNRESDIIGIAGVSIPIEYYDRMAIKLIGNIYDWELVPEEKDK